MLTKQELTNLIEDVLAHDQIDDFTFDQCIQRFSKHFAKPDWFKACTCLCYLIESQVRPFEVTCSSSPSRKELWPFISSTKCTTTSRMSQLPHLKQLFTTPSKHVHQNTLQSLDWTLPKPPKTSCLVRVPPLRLPVSMWTTLSVRTVILEQNISC